MLTEPPHSFPARFLRWALRVQWPWALLWVVPVAWLFRLTWLGWGHMIIDTGVEMYTPWALASGKVLYRDFFYAFGPFTPYLHALLYIVFKPHLYVLYASGLVTCVLTCWLIQRLASRHLAPWLGAFVAQLFVLASAFGYYNSPNIFNYIAPYSYTTIHSMLFCLAALWFHGRHLETRLARHRALALGFLFLATITRYEIGAFLAAALGCGWLLDTPAGGGGRRWLLREAGLLSLPLLSAAAVYGLFFAAAWGGGFKEAFVGLFTAYDFSERPKGFYAWSLGIVRPVLHLKEIALSAAATLGAGLSLGAACACIGQLGRRPRLAIALAWIGLAAGLWWLGVKANHVVSTRLAVKYLPVLCAVLAVFYARRAIRSAGDRRREAVLLATLGVLSVFSLLRIFLRTNFGFYGFYLTVPGLILSQVFFLRELPSLLPWQSIGRFVRLGFVLHFLLVGFAHQDLALAAGSRLTREFRSARGAMRVGDTPRMRCLRQIVDRLGSLPEPKPGLVVFPEGIAVNFFTGLENPLYLHSYLPLDLAPPGTKDSVVRQLELKKPEYVVEVVRNVRAFNRRGFDVDYGVPIVNYLDQEYSLVSFEPNACMLLRRREFIEQQEDR